MLKKLAGGDSEQNIMNVINSIMGNKNIVDSIFNNEAFQDISKATEDKEDFLDIFSAVFSQVATNQKVFDMVNNSTKTMQEEI